MGRGGIMNVGGIQSDFGCHQGWTASRISFFSWWNKENRVLIFPILQIAAYFASAVTIAPYSSFASQGLLIKATPPIDETFWG